MSELKPCPFCGETPEVRDNQTHFSVFCGYCCADGPSDWKKELSIDQWNSRTPIKWPTHEQILKAAQERDCRGGFLSLVDWLKSFVEKGD